ncbi:putative metalloprotease CJM1_0395 family protein [Shewanella sp.]|uniref:putative metalloprotease CJM1_0395 family protein n=1 Tax=Shewanella sp. TaxID=50422 RepID=UPI003A85A82D
MSVMALSSQIGAPSSSFLGADKSIEPPKGGKPQSGQTYQGGNGQAVVNLSTSTVSLNAPKFEASGALEPSLSGLGAVMDKAAPVSASQPELTIGVASSRPSMSSSVDGTSAQKAFTDLGANAKAQLHSNPFDSRLVNSRLVNSSLLASNNSSFSLLTGARSISGLRDGQIAAMPAVSALSVPDVGLTAPSSTINPFASLAPSFTAATVATNGGSVNSASLGLANIFSTSIATSPSTTSQGHSNVTTAINPFEAEFAGVDVAGTYSGSTPSAFANPGAQPDSDQPSSLSEQFNNIFGQPEAANGPADVGTTANAQTQQQQSQTEQNQTQAQLTRDEQAKQARGQAAQEQEKKQQTLAEVFAKVDQSEQAQQTQNEQTRQQDLAKEQVKQAQEKAIEQQKAQVEELKSRDTEVKAHELAHATVGGQYAQSPSFKYEKGADGQRYATDGEVQIDVSIVPGDPLATINKMKQVYAAAMAPVDPSSADIRVAAEALQKMNDAKAKLAQERQQQIIDQPTTETLIGAEAQIEGLPPLKERQIQVTGEIDANGNIAAPQDAPAAPVTEVIDKIKQAIAAQVASNNTSDTVNATEVEPTEPIEPPTATLAMGTASNRDEPPQVSKQRLEFSSRYDKDLSNTAPRDSNAMRFYGSVAVATLASKENAELSQHSLSVNTLERISNSALPTHSITHEGESVISNGLVLESSNRQASRGLFNPQTLALHRPSFLDVNA